MYLRIEDMLEAYVRVTRRVDLSVATREPPGAGERYQRRRSVAPSAQGGSPARGAVSTRV